MCNVAVAVGLAWALALVATWQLYVATWQLSALTGEMAEMRAQASMEPRPRAAHPAQSGAGRLAGVAVRKLAKIGMVDWASAAQDSGCVRVDVGNAGVTLALNTKACNGHRCPQCFGLNTTPGVGLHALTLTGCQDMYITDAQQLGSGVFQTAFQQFEFVNLNSRAKVAISDGARTFLIPAGAYVWGHCLADGSGEILMDMSLRTYFKPGGSFTERTGAAAWSARHYHAAVVRTDGAVLVLGGYDGGNKNDVYSSADGGATWTQLTGAAAWSGRRGHAAVVRTDGAVLVLGGRLENDVYNSEVLENDVYSSEA